MCFSIDFLMCKLSGQFFQSQKSKTYNPTILPIVLNFQLAFTDFVFLFKNKINADKSVQHLPPSTLLHKMK
jgi:hypothetical protein